jgi:hypothetical protein
MCFSPTLETWLLAISCGHFITWPGLTTANVRRYLPKSEATAKGHLDQQRKNLRSTKDKPFNEVEADFHPTPETEPTNFVFAAVVDYETASTSFILT